MLSMHRAPELSTCEEVIQTLGMTDPRVAMRQDAWENEVLPLKKPGRALSTAGIDFGAMLWPGVLSASHDEY